MQDAEVTKSLGLIGFSQIFSDCFEWLMEIGLLLGSHLLMVVQFTVRCILSCRYRRIRSFLRK